MQGPMSRNTGRRTRGAARSHERRERQTATPDADRVRELVKKARALIAAMDGVWKETPAVKLVSMMVRDGATLFTAAEAWADPQAREKYEPLAEAACASVRQLLHEANVPSAAFIDDHVGNLIVLHKQAQQRIAELEAERDRMRAALRRIDAHAPDETPGPNWYRVQARNALEQADG